MANTDYNPKNDKKLWKHLLKLLYFSQGYFIPILRLSESAFRETAVSRIQNLFTKCKERNDEIHLSLNDS